MDLRKIKSLLDLVAESGVAEFEICEGPDRIRVINHPQTPVQVVQTTAPAPASFHDDPPALPASNVFLASRREI